MRPPTSLGDAEGGEPVVPNGMALCKLHHAAFDRNILDVRPDLRVAIRQDVLEEIDAPCSCMASRISTVFDSA